MGMTIVLPALAIGLCVAIWFCCTLLFGSKVGEKTVEYTEKILSDTNQKKKED